MCFGGNDSTPTAAAPAPAPAAPDPIAAQTEVGSAAKAQNLSNYGTQAPDLRIDKAVTSGGVAAGGTGLRM